MNIVGKRNWYFAFSLIIIIPGVISLLLWGLNLSIDFTGGSEMTLSYPKQVNEKTIDGIKKSFASEKIEIVSITPAGKTITIRTKPMDDKQDAKTIAELQK